jgi:hypothetical protein
MTQEEKFEEAKRLYETANADQRYVLESLFPELRESEDERIRKAMIDFFKHEREEGIAVLHYGVNIERMIAWLEKQGQKSAAWSEEDENRINDTIYFLETAKKHYASTVELDACIDLVKSIRHQNRWKPSERQKEALLWCVVHLGGADKQVLGELLEELNKL